MTRPTVIVYTSARCPFCTWSKRLLDKKQAAYEEIKVDGSDASRILLQERSGRTSVPQIFIGDYHVGGYEDMILLDQAGKLDKLLSGESPTSKT